MKNSVIRVNFQFLKNNYVTLFYPNKQFNNYL